MTVRAVLRLAAALWLAATPLLAFSPSALSHETPIALLELREVQPGAYIAQWTYSSSANMQPPTAVYPEQCTLDPPRLECGDQGLVGKLTLERLGLSYSAAVIRLTRLDSPTQSFTLTGAQPEVVLTPDGRLPLAQVFASYVPLGFEHILLGVDHLLFVLGLMLLVTGVGPLIKTITAFTIAHSFTLAAATLGWIGVPEGPVNAAIALSIAVVAVEVINERRGQRTWSGQYPWAVAFGFGLLHGLGFASALTGIGLPPENVPSALLFFNVGVELGQIAFVLLVLALLWAHRRLQAELPQWSTPIGVYAMGAVASFWLIDRVVRLVWPPVVL
ncbi:MAG: HupE/UreJ family protein [Pseudomonadota bacterium]